ncbi:hypothetical protein GTZ78_02175, partial [Streptomyces sp. SID8361]|nr:hypothetical protein [Streptomyces sp. SID8361]
MGLSVSDGPASGTGMWTSPQQGRWAVLLTNKLYSTRDRQPLTDIRNAFRTLALRLRSAFRKLGVCGRG